MKYLFSKAAVILVAMVMAANAQDTDILITSFEDYVLGNVHNQQDWEVESGNAIITDSTEYIQSGSKSLNFVAQSQTLVVSNTTYGGSEPGITGVVYVDVYVKINSMAEKDFALSGYDLFGGSSKRAFVLEFDTPSGSSGDFRIYNGSSKLKIGTYNFGEWNRISARVDYDHDVYQVIFNGSEAVMANFRESYTPTASGTRQAGVKEYHELRVNLGYNGALGSVNAAVDDIYVSTNPIADVSFPEPDITHVIEVDQPDIGNISLDPDLEEYEDSTHVTATLNIPEGYTNAGWTGDLSGTELIKNFFINNNMNIGASVEVDTSNPPPLYTVTVNQPEFGEITLSPSGGTYYDFTSVTALLDLPIGYINEGWTGDLSGAELEKEFEIHQNMEIGATVVLDTTPPVVYTVSTASELHNLCESDLKPGDIIEVENGAYNTGGITMEASGTKSKPIIIRAINVGEAKLTGSSYFVFRKNAHIILEGFHFTSDPYTVIKLEACNNIRITRNTFQLTESEGKNGKWILIGGYWDDGSLLSHHNRIDHNIFRDKHQLGNFITIDGGDVVSQHDRIDHNYFYNIGPRHDNEMEAIRVGWSALSLTDGFTVIEYNLFEECDGDPEIISIKSCKDTVRYNTIKRSQGTVSLRHGDGSVVHDNFFLGDEKDGTGGVRIYARNHKIYNNYFESLRGHTWDAAITLTNGDTDTGSLSSHWRIDNLIVANNTLVNNYSNIEIGYAKADGSWKKEPRNVKMTDNLVVGDENNLIKIMTEPTNLTWSGNIMFPQGTAELGLDAIESEIKIVDPLLSFSDSLWLISAESPAINASVNNYIDIVDDMQGQQRSGVNDVGADEYSALPITRAPLKPENVGPNAVDIVNNLSYNEKYVQQFSLSQNYPNPFNPNTTISFELPKANFTTLRIYNIAGQQIASLVNGRLPAGLFQVQWNAEEMSSGIYFYTLKSGAVSQTKRMLLLK
ncbi:MAG: T9SS C-terminal target domain-containing protein [Calditrichaeota bacterium]|nr:MAG: T9SS C-terminal target domain-containing protein [Calditrichota bacterium]MBL1207036.1 T9SS C-terminal target domain-containing protein [Calditrichota bacterium]NOG46863.1 T9SS type A sorting domain-containing protein [Calditrichota bacterium]